MKAISLSRGYMALVDDEDFERFGQFKWSALVVRGGHVYAHRRVKNLATGRTDCYLLHRVICGVTERKIIVDHHDHDGLNNRRANLRVCTQRENIGNSRKLKQDKSSRYKGVYWWANWFKDGRGKWAATIKANSRDKAGTYLGAFDSEEDAARAYDVAARATFGEFANCNFPDSPMTTAQLSELRRSTKIIFRGSEKLNAILDEDKVREIKRLRGSATITAIARQFGVDRSTVSLIYRDLTWRYVTDGDLNDF